MKHRIFLHALPVALAATLLPFTAAQERKSGVAGKPIIVKAKRVLPVAGSPLDDGLILIREGKIEAIGKDLSIPADAELIEIRDSVVTPGLIDAHAAIEPDADETARQPRRQRPRTLWQEIAEKHVHNERDGCKPSCDAIQAAPRQSRPDVAERLETFAPYGAAPEAERPWDTCAHSVGTLGDQTCAHCGAGPDTQDPRAATGGIGYTWAEHSAEVTPHLRVIDSVNLLSQDFTRLLRGGVTTVWISPDSGTVIGMRGAIVKTAGPLAERIVVEADGVKASLGGDPIRRGGGNRPPFLNNVTFRVRRPTTRMGVNWVFRKAFYDAIRVKSGKEMFGADMPPAEAVPYLVQIMEGSIPLRIQARMQHDILSAIRMAREVGLDNGAASRLGRPFILEEGTEAYRCLAELRAAKIPVIYGPIFDQPEGWRAFTGETAETRLNGATQLRDAGVEFALTAHDLRDESGLARQAMMAKRYGLTADEALRAVTAAPARLLGLDGKLGVLVPGTAADLVIWNGDPTEATSKPLVVMIDGAVVYRD